MTPDEQNKLRFIEMLTQLETENAHLQHPDWTKQQITEFIQQKIKEEYE